MHAHIIGTRPMSGHLALIFLVLGIIAIALKDAELMSGSITKHYSQDEYGRDEHETMNEEKK